MGKDRGGATVEVGGSLNCCSTAQQFGRFVTLELKTGEHRQHPTGVRLRLWCGTSPPPPPPEHPLLERVVGETTDCAADVSPHLFSSNLAFPNCCYCCGSTEDLVDEEEPRGRYQRVHQVCGACKERGRVARTHGCCSGRQAHEEVITRQRTGGPPHCLQFPALVLNSNRSSLSFVKAVGI